MEREREGEIATTAPDLICTIINTIANVCVGLKRCRVIIRCFVSFVFLCFFLRAGVSYDPTSTCRMTERRHSFKIFLFGIIINGALF